MIKSNLLVVLILLNFLHAYKSVSPDVTPTDWVEDPTVAACDAIGAPKISEDQSSVVPLTSEYVYLKTSYTFNVYLNDAGKKVYDQSIYKYYFQLANTDGVSNLLSISQISGKDGSIITQTTTIATTQQFIDANGPFVLLKQTQAGDNIALFSFDSTPASSTVTRLSTIDLSTYPNEIFKSVQLYLGSGGKGNVKTDPNYMNIIGTVVSINTQTTKTVVRQILSTGIDAILYTFPMNNIGSEIYTNLLLGLQIQGSNFYTYICPLFGSGSTSPFSYVNDQTAIATSAGLYSNNIVLSFIRSFMIATYDDNGQNGNIFSLVVDKDTYVLSLTNIKTTTAAPNAASLQYFTDHSTYIIELNVDPATSTFYIVWADDPVMFNYNFLNSLGDNKNSQIILDFSNNHKISSFCYGVTNPDDSVTQTLYLWIYVPTNIIKYTLTVQQDSNGNVVTNTINKEFTAQLNENLLVNQVASNFQVTTELKCVCQTPQVTEMICFYGTDACTFTVQNQPTFCVPNIPA